MRHHTNESALVVKTEGLFKCNICPQVFDGQEELKVHLDTHSSEAEPYKCAVCGKVCVNRRQIFYCSAYKYCPCHFIGL